MPKSPSGEKRIKVLDGLRGLALLQVVAFHYYLSPSPSGTGFLVIERLARVVDGLVLFFVLSGFLIGGILLDARQSPKLFRVFYTRRFFRLMPVYFLLLATYWTVRLVDERTHSGLIYYWHSEIPFWSYLLFCQNYLMVHAAAFGAPWLVVTWSLAVEQQFYLIAPFVIRYVTGWRLQLVCICCLVSGTFLRTSHVPDILLSHRLDELAAGVLLAILTRMPTFCAFMDRGRRGWRLVVGLYFLSAGVLRIANVDSAFLFNWAVMAVGIALLIYLLLDGTHWPVVMPAIELLAPIGLLSYFMYLFHVPVLYLFQGLCPRAVLAALPTTFVLAMFSHRYLERPMIRLGHRLSYGVDRREEAASAAS